MVECIFCNIAQGKAPTFKVYEDNQFIAALDINPGNKGHVIVFSKSHKTSLMDLSNSERSHLINIATQMMTGIKRATKCGGINMVYSLGELAGQRTNHFIVHLIPRFNEDKVVIYWEPKKLDENEFKDVQKKLSEEFSSVSAPAMSIEKPVEVIKEDKEEEEIHESPNPNPGYW